MKESRVTAHRVVFWLCLFPVAFLPFSSAIADCPVSLSVGGRDAQSLMDVTVSTAGNCGGSNVGVEVDGLGAGHYACDNPFSPQGITPSCTNTFKVDTSCWGSGPHVVTGYAHCGFKDTDDFCRPHSGESTASASFNNRPTASLSISGADAFGKATVSIHAHFQTLTNGRQYVRLVRNGDINDVVAEARPPDGVQDFDWSPPFDLNCLTGELQLQSVAMTCGAHWSVIGGNPVPSDPSLIGYSGLQNVVTEQKPSASLSIGPPDESGVAIATVTGTFKYLLAGRRYVRLFRNGDISDVVRQERPADDQSSVTFEVSIGPFCGTPPPYRAAAMTCGAHWSVIGGNPVPSDPAFIGYSGEMTPEDLDKPSVGVSLEKGAMGANGTRKIKATVDFDFKQTSGKLTLDLKTWTDAAGQTHPGYTLQTWTSIPNTSSPVTYEFSPPSGARQVLVVATAEACGKATAEASIECGCEGTNDPVYFADGNVRVTDVDPLPMIAGHRLVRTYNSDEQVVAPFGRGWTTPFERRMILNTDNDEQLVSLVTASDEVVTFRGTGSTFRQTWPRSDRAPGTLVYDSIAGTYAHRAAGSSEVAVFRASDGRLVALRDLPTGHEAQFTYDAQGLPQTLTDSWSGTSWNITADTANRRIASIVVSGRPDLLWSYAYDADGNLLTVTAPGDNTWRTYEYSANRMTASYDGTGDLIESHTYDADGYGVSSTGPGDEIASIAYNLPGSVAQEQVTRVTYKTGATADYALRPVGGAHRVVRATGGCSSCGAGDATYVHDEKGRVIREQGPDGYVAVKTYTATQLASQEQYLKPAGCDPATDAQRCRLDPDALATALLESTVATIQTTFTYADPLWPDRVTRVVRPSVRAPGSERREDYVYHPTTGALTRTTVRGWTGDPPTPTERITTTTYYGVGNLSPPSIRAARSHQRGSRSLSRRVRPNRSMDHGPTWRT
jgi:YD repeat-containing protein